MPDKIHQWTIVPIDFIELEIFDIKKSLDLLLCIGSILLSVASTRLNNIINLDI